MNLPWPHRGELADRILAFDWGSTALGPLAQWPAPLRHAVDLILDSPLPMALVWGDQLRLLYNDAYATVVGRRHPQVLGMNLLEAWPEVAELNRQILARVLRGEPVSYREIPLEFDFHGQLQTTWLNLDYSPLRDAQQRPCGWLAIIADVSGQVLTRRAHQAAEDAYRQAKEQMDLALDTGAVIGTWSWAVPSDRVTGDSRFARLFAFTPQEIGPGLPMARFLARVHPDDLAELQVHIQQALTQGTPFRQEYRVRPPGSEPRWVDAAGRCEMDADGQPQRFAGVIIDIHERKLAEQQQRILVHELNHRVKNTLAIVQSIALQSFGQARSLEDASAVFNARLIALARAHEVVTEGQWQNASLRELSRKVVLPHASGHRLSLQGPEVPLPPHEALSLAMAFHELATNAVKYGALGVQGGQVQLHWQRLEVEGRPVLQLDWIEQGGPAVVPPEREGFGSRLIRRSLGARAGSEVQLHYHPQGLHCHARIPLAVG